MTEEDYSFHPPYLITCAAHKIPPPRWHDITVKQDSKIKFFIQRVAFEIGFDDKFGLTRLEDPQAELTSAEVIARGQTFKKVAKYRKGMWRPEEFRMTDDELIDKFKNCASTILPPDKVNATVKTVFELDKLENVTDLTKLLFL